MSYILDALKKSDRQRKLGQVPDLRTEHAPMLYREERTSRLPLVVGLVVGGVLLNLTGWLWWAKPWRAEEQPVVVREELAPVSGPESGADLGLVGPGVTMAPATLLGPAIDQAAEFDRSPAAGSAEPDAALQSAEPMAAVPEPEVRSSAAAPPLAYAALPDQIRNALPKIMVSLHYFSDQPAARLAIINDRDLREGDMVTADLQLLEINEAGVILGCRGYRFQVDKF